MASKIGDSNHVVDLRLCFDLHNIGTPSSTKDMNVLLLTGRVPTASDPTAARFVVEHARSLIDCGHNVRVLCILPGNRFGVSITAVEGLPITVATFRVVRGASFIPMLLAALAGVSRIQNGGEWTPSVAHAHITIPSGLAAVAISLRHGIPFVVTEHTGPVKERAAGWTGVVTRFVWRRASHLIAVSSSLAVEMRHEGAVGPVSVIANPVKVNEPLPEQGTVRAGLLWVGRGNDYRKAPELALRAVAVARSYGRDMPKLTFVGPDLSSSLAEEVDGLGLKELVHFTGPLSPPEVHRHMSEVSVVVVSSRYETFSVVAAEALCCGALVLATRCGGPHDIVLDGSGMIVDMSAESIAWGLIALMEVAENADRRAIALDVRARYSYGVIGLAVTKLYDNIAM